MRRMRRDEGAAAVLVAMLMVVLVGMTALAVDMGSMHLQNRELQNSADAGALAIAEQCAGGACPGDVNAEARGYALANSTTGGGFFENTDATAAVDLAARSVTVTATGDNTPLFRGVLGQGDAAFTRSATVVWGSPTGIVGAIPLTISDCEFNNLVPTEDQLTSADALYAAKEGTAPWPSGEVTFRFHEATTDVSGCQEMPSGGDHPGGFGWLEPDGTSCTTTTNVDGYYDTSTGNSIPNDCPKADFAALRGTIVPLPVYEEIIDPQGSNAQYVISGFAAFFLSGYRFPSIEAPSYATGVRPCNPSDTCISGWFTSATLTDATSLGPVGAGGGVTVIQLVD